MWKVAVSVDVRDEEGKILKSYNWEYMTEDESLIGRIVEKAPFLGVRRVLLDLEQVDQEDAKARRRQDELARDMKRLYDAVRLCGIEMDGGRIVAAEAMVQGVLLAKGIDEKTYLGLKEKAMHSEVIKEFRENPGWLVMMRGLEPKT